MHLKKFYAMNGSLGGAHSDHHYSQKWPTVVRVSQHSDSLTYESPH